MTSQTTPENLRTEAASLRSEALLKVGSKADRLIGQAEELERQADRGETFAPSTMVFPSFAVGDHVQTSDGYSGTVSAVLGNVATALGGGRTYGVDTVQGPTRDYHGSELRHGTTSPTINPSQADRIKSHVQTAESAVSAAWALNRHAHAYGTVDASALKRAALDLERAGCALRRLAAKLEG